MEIIVENVNGVKHTYLKGIMTEANMGVNDKGVDFSFRGRNRNGRYYPYSVLEKAVLKFIDEVKNNNGMYSYLSHPNNTNLVESESCGKIIEVEWLPESGRAICKIEILQHTTQGAYVLEQLKYNKAFGVSTRGLGSLDENSIVKDDLLIITADVIKQFDGEMQSCQSCTLSLTESIQSNYDDYLININETCGCIYAKLDNDRKKIAENYLVEQFTKCLQSL